MDKIAFLKGLLAGQDTDSASKEGKVYYAICEALEELLTYTQELEDRVAELEELCDILDEDLGDLEDFLCDEMDEDDDEDDCSSCFCTSGCMDDDDEEQYTAICPTCGKCIILDEETLEEGETVCPGCGEELDFNFDELEIETLEADSAE